MSLQKPDADELAEALCAADAMRAQDDDPHHVAIALHYLNDRCQDLESLLTVVDRYLRFGLPEHELSEMRLLVDRLREGGSSRRRHPSVDDSLPI